MIIINKGYNNYKPLRYIPDSIINYLINNNEVIWKLFKYNTPDALFKNNLTLDEKRELIYKGFRWDGTRWVSDDSKNKAVWKQPFDDNVNTEAQTMLHIFLSNIHPQNKNLGTVYYTFEIVTHMKCLQVMSDLGDKDNEVAVTSENRVELITQQILETLNGAEVGSIGRIFFDMEGGYMTKSASGLYNNRNYCGNRIILGCRINGTE